MLYRNNIPQIDLHGEDRISAGIKIKLFIEESIILENKEIAIVHGVGEGILKKETHKILKADKRILSYKTDYFNSGCTIVKIK